MSCTPCNNNSSVITLQAFNQQYNYNCGCTDGDCGCNGVSLDAKCIFYTGPSLPCSQINTNEDLESALIKIDQKLCTTLGNYAVYNKGCIDPESTIATEADFVEAISTYACTLRTDFNTFVNTTFTDYQSDVDERFDAIESPAITCAAVGITAADSLTQVYGKYCLAFADIYNKLSISGVSWDSCYTVNPDPTTIQEAFNTIISQICDIKSNLDFDSEGLLPTFNNIGTCLPGTLTATDSLVDTIGKIKTRLCATPTFDINALTWGCVSKPNNTTTDLQSAFNTLLGQVSLLKQSIPTFDSGDFDVVLNDSEDACSGVTVSLAPAAGTDRLVAVDNSDSSPGTLVQKLQAGSNITFDVATTPGKLIINSSGGATTDTQVKLNVADTSSGYLADKVEGTSDSSNGIDITVTEDNTDHRLNIATTVNFTTLWTELLEFLDANPTVKAAFCERVTSCLPDCIIPPNVTVIYNNTNSTTSTTTTTTTTTP